VRPRLRLSRRLFTWSILLLSLLSVISSAAFSQGTVVVILRQPPPNVLRLSDLWELTIVNATGQPIPNVHLVATVTEGNATVLTATSAVFRLGGGSTTLSGHSAGLPSITVNYQNPSFRDAITRTGNAPSGDYTVCVDVMNSSPASGSVSLGQGCFSESVRLISAPVLLTPADGMDVSEKYPVFSWTLTGPAATGAARASTEYTIRIVEIIGRQSPTAAMQANPAWFERGNLTTPTLPYPPSARPLSVNTRYAWKVSAVQAGLRRGGNAVLPDALLAESEVWVFTVPPPADNTDRKQLAPAAVLTMKKKIDVLEELLRSCSDAGPARMK
jgi:hypothetical protein